MPTKAYFPRPHRYIDGPDRGGRGGAEPPWAEGPGPGPGRGGTDADPSRAKNRSDRIAGHAHPDFFPADTSPAAPRTAPSPGSARDRRAPQPRSGPSAAAPVAIGEWLWACRVGSEADLCDELQSYGIAGRVVQPGLCASPARPRTPQKEDAELTFARQGLPVQAVSPADAAAVAAIITELFADPRQAQKGSGLALHVFAPDSDAGNLLAAEVLALQGRLTTALSAAGIPLVADGRTAHAEGGRLAQVCLLTAAEVAIGILPARAAPSLFPGGRQRFKKPKDAPARSALKLTEALAWVGHGPQAGEVCVDLGAAPGGWCQVLLDRRCHVVAIDPGRLAPHLAGRVEHLRVNAFGFEPEIPADWVLCDMAYRPLEVAALLAKWGRRRWAQFLLANIKLPMNRRVDMLARVREILTTGGWTGLRMRQLYHDRHEVTLTAWRGFGIDTRVARPPASDSPGGQPGASGPQRSAKGRVPPPGRRATPAQPPAARGRGREQGRGRGQEQSRSPGQSRGQSASRGTPKPARKPGRPRR